MPYTPVVVDTFGGLDLVNDSLDIGFTGATDMANADIDQRGRIGSRPGFREVIAAPTVSTYPPMTWYRDVTGVDYVVADGVTVKADGSATSTAGPITGVSNNSWARFGTTLCGVDGGTNQIDTFDGAAWGTVALPVGFSPTMVASAPFDGRLALADDSTVFFSDPDSTTVDPLNFVTLSPGDGERIRALVSWRELLFAFKQTKFFVFYGTSVDSTGGPLFNYRTVNAGLGVYGHGAAVAGDEGVYFSSRDTAFVTTGDVPVTISRALGKSAPFDNITDFSGAHSYFQGRFFRAGPGNTTWVYDPQVGQWLKWTIKISGMCAGPDGRSLYVVSSLTTNVGVFDPAARTDKGTTNTNGDSIAWHYETGWSDLGTPDRKVIRELSGWGYGLVNIQLTGDRPGATLSETMDMTAFTFAPVEAPIRYAVRGSLFQFHVAGATGAQTNVLHRLVFSLRDQEEPK